MNEMEAAFRALLDLLPECACGTAPLCSAAGYFDVSAAEIRRAAELLPENHDYQYKGVRLLLALCIEEFADSFREDSPPLWEVTVPAPPVLVYSLQEARQDLRFCSSAFFAQIVLRGLLLHREPVSLFGCAKKRCGLNLMREKLFTEPPGRRPEGLLQFGVLCDECVKTGELPGMGSAAVHSLVLPKGADRGYSTAKAEGFLSELQAVFQAELSGNVTAHAASLYGRLLRAEQRIEAQLKKEGKTLSGNSLALAQTVQLLSARRIGRMIEALEILAGELEAAEKGPCLEKICCFYIPFLQPEICTAFRRGGAALVGGTAFSKGKTAAWGYTLPQMTAAWYSSMAVRGTAEEECAYAAAEVREWGSRCYLTGSFRFDRWLGALAPMQRKLMKERYGIDTVVLPADFWSESITGGLETRIESLCSRLLEK